MNLHYSILEYRYNTDSTAHKAAGALLLSGDISFRDIKSLIECLAAGREFVAEHVGIPALYDDAWALRDDKDEDALDFHEFVDLRPAKIDEILDMRVFDEAGALLRRFVTASVKWKGHEVLSTHETLLEEA